VSHDVFLSHSATDRRVADAICARLEADGVSCWIAPRDIPPGTPWADALIEAIGASRVLLLLVSSRSNASKQVLREVSAASEASVPVLPIRVENVRPSAGLGYFLGPEHWLDAIESPFERHLPAIRDAVRVLLGSAGERAGTTAPADGALRGPAPSPRRFARLVATPGRRAALVGALATVALGLGVFAWSRRSATLSIESEPAAAVASIDGAEVGSTPLSISVPAGGHGVHLRHPGFRDWSRVVEVAAGERTSFSLQLVVADARDANAVNLLATGLGVSLPRLETPLADRSTPVGRPVELIVPRGSVRVDDLVVLSIDADPAAVEPSGVVALRDGETTIFEAPFAPPHPVFDVPIPPTAREALRAGATLTWGWWPKGGVAVTAEIRLVADDVAPVLSAIERRLAVQPEASRRHLKAQAMLDRGLFTGAYLEAQRLVAEDPDDLRAQAVMEQALSRSDGGGLRAAARLRAAILSASAAARATVFVPSAASDGR
jgi:hypothetical protein